MIGQMRYMKITKPQDYVLKKPATTRHTSQRAVRKTWNTGSKPGMAQVHSLQHPRLIPHNDPTDT